MNDLFSALSTGFTLAARIFGIVLTNATNNSEAKQKLINDVQNSIDSFQTSNTLQNEFDAQKQRMDAEEKAEADAKKKQEKKV